MELCAVFLDAGYLFAGARLVFELERRAPIRCRYQRLVGQLDYQARLNSVPRSLRLYWYDAAENAVPTAEQREIAGLTKVKLRLGRLVNNRQKGVDALIMRDLMTLGRERAISHAFLLSGDEDLREGVLAVQDMGVQVVLMGFVSRPGAAQAQSLIDECDGHFVLNDDFWRPLFEVPPAAPPPPPAPAAAP